MTGESAVANLPQKLAKSVTNVPQVDNHKAPRSPARSTMQLLPTAYSRSVGRKKRAGGGPALQPVKARRGEFAECVMLQFGQK